MRRLVFEMNHPEATPLFNGQAKADPAIANPANETWRTVPVREGLHGLGKKVYEGIEKLGIETVGALMDWKNAKPERWWTDIEGVGKAACDKLDDAIEKFMVSVTVAAAAQAMDGTVVDGVTVNAAAEEQQEELAPVT